MQLERANVSKGPIFRRIRNGEIRGRMYPDDFLALTRIRCEQAGFMHGVAAFLCAEDGYMADCRRRAVAQIARLQVDHPGPLGDRSQDIAYPPKEE